MYATDLLTPPRSTAAPPRLAGRFMDTSLEAEATLGNQSFTEVMQQYRAQILPASHADARFVQAVVDRIVRANALEPPGQSGWQTFVIRDETKNAFVTPGGHIFVFTGILPVAKGADGLAVILGHGGLKGGWLVRWGVGDCGGGVADARWWLQRLRIRWHGIVQRGTRP